MTSMPLRCAQISSCSTAAARKVSAAQSTTLRPSWRSRFASFPMLVVLPAPFTPTMKITRVPLPFCEAEMPLPAATSGRTGVFRMRMMCESEEHTSELQSLRHLVCRLLLEKKKKIQKKEDDDRKYQHHIHI